MSLSERIKIRLEICYENFLDFLGQSAFRKPLLMLVGVGVIMTLKNSRHSIASFKRSYMPSFASKWSSPNQFSPYGSTSAYNSYGSSPSYGSASSYGGTTGAYGNAGIGAKTPLGAQYGGGSMATGSMSAPYGGATSNASPYQQRPQQSYGQTGGAMAQTTSTFGNNLRGTTQISASFSTSRLVDQHGQNVQVAQGGLFQDYGGITSFMGQIDTVSAMESLSSVQQILNSPGNGKVLVVDGGGSFNGAVLDELTATAGQRNGWKGVIINGVVRNADELKKIQFGVKAIGAHLSVGQQSNSQRGSPLSFGGVNFTPGSWIYADQDGIIVSPTSLNVGGGGGTLMANNSFGGSPGIQQANTFSSMQGNNYSSGGIAGRSSSTYGQTSQQLSAPRTNTSFGGGAQQQPFQQQRPIGASTSFGGGGGLGQQYQAGSKPAAQRGYTSTSYGKGASPYGNTSSYFGGQKRKKPSKKTLLGLLFLVCVLAWNFLGD